MKKLYTTILLLTLISPFLGLLAKENINPPSNVKIFRNNGIAKISWTNSKDLNFSKTTIFQSTISIEDYFSFEAVQGLCEKIYEGKANSYTDTNLAENLTYYYILFSSNVAGDHSKAIVIEKKAFSSDQETTNNEVIGTNNNQTANNTLAKATSKIVNKVSKHEAGLIYNFNKELNIDPGSNSARLALFIIVKSPHDLTKQDKNAISYFIASGTPTTIILGSGERTGVLNSYLSVFNKLPTNILEWQDVIKISNGRWPDERNLKSEKKASDEFFSTIYKRQPNMDDPHDNAAVTVIAYGLRPAERNIENEKNAINIYRSIFNKAPVEATDWDLVRAIAYSGASR